MTKAATDEVSLRGGSTAKLRAMREAGDTVVECFQVLARTGDNIVGELLKHQGTFYEWNHYPEGDIFDSETHSQYYYHAHPADDRPGEHGHFHTFLRPKGMPEGVRPAPVPDYAAPENPDDAVTHLIAVAMDDRGIPVKLFTTNRWVTGEVWYAAADVCRCLDRFAIEHAQPSWPVNRWLTGMLLLFRPQCRALIEARDEAVAEWARAHPDTLVYEDRAFDVASEVPIDVDAQIARIDAELAKR